MESLIKVMDWPPIIQGAIGSAIFWLVLVATQKTIDKSWVRLTKFGHTVRKEVLYQELFHEKLMRQVSDTPMGACQYQALSYLVRGAIFLGFGLIVAPVMPVFLAVGGAGFIYYAYRAMGWLEPFVMEPNKSMLETWQRICEIETQLYGAAKPDTLTKIESLKSEAKAK